MAVRLCILGIVMSLCINFNVTDNWGFCGKINMTSVAYGPVSTEVGARKRVSYLGGLGLENSDVINYWGICGAGRVITTKGEVVALGETFV